MSVIMESEVIFKREFPIPIIIAGPKICKALEGLMNSIHKNERINKMTAQK